MIAISFTILIVNLVEIVLNRSNAQDYKQAKLNFDVNDDAKDCYEKYVIKKFINYLDHIFFTAFLAFFVFIFLYYFIIFPIYLIK